MNAGVSIEDFISPKTFYDLNHNLIYLSYSGFRKRIIAKREIPEHCVGRRMKISASDARRWIARTSGGRF